MENKEKKPFVFSSYLFRILFGTLFGVFLILIGRAYNTTKLKGKESLLHSQTKAGMVLNSVSSQTAAVKNCDPSISDSYTLNSGSTFDEKSSLRGGGQTPNNNCDSGSCTSLGSKGKALAKKIALDFSAFREQTSLRLKASKAAIANRSVETKKAKFKTFYHSDKSLWTRNQTKLFYEKALSMPDMFDPTITRQKLNYVKGSNDINIRFHRKYVTIGNNFDSYETYKTNKEIFQNRLQILIDNGTNSNCKFSFKIRENYKAPKLVKGANKGIQSINSKIEGDHVLGSKIYRASKRNRENGQVVFKPWITHAAQGYARKLEEKHVCFPQKNVNVKTKLTINRTSFAAKHNIDDFFFNRQTDARNAIRRIPQSQFLPELPRNVLEVTEFKALQQEHKNYKYEKALEGYTKSEMLYELNASLCAQESFDEVERFTKTVKRDLTFCQNSRGDYTFAKKKAERYGKVMMLQALQTQTYIKGVKVLNPRPPNLANTFSHALTDRCDLLLLEQRVTMKKMINQLKKAGVSHFDNSMEYFENHSDTMRGKTALDLSSGMTPKKLDQLGSVLQVSVVENERQTQYSLPKPYNFCLEKLGRDLVPTDSAAFAQLQETGRLHDTFYELIERSNCYELIEYFREVHNMDFGSSETRIYDDDDDNNFYIYYDDDLFDPWRSM